MEEHRFEQESQLAHKKFKASEKESMNYRTYIVTGGNSGIGKAIALGIARGKANQVVIISRSPQKGADALAEIREKSQNDAVELVVGDLGTIENCRKLASELLEQYPKIHVLINNAAVWMFERVINEDGLEMGFMVNHLAPFILSNLLNIYVFPQISICFYRTDRRQIEAG
jgi:NAD(P)-dependent dehydrogenase (short-subunit alcohol dehydrogenase family)